MKKIFTFIITLILSLNLIACSKQNSDEIFKFQNNLNSILIEIEKIHNNINSLDTTDTNAPKIMLNNLSDLKDAFKDLSKLKITDDKHSYITGLAEEGSDYMEQAYDLFKEAYSKDILDEETADLAYKYLERATKRINVIVTMLHGEVPDDVIIHE